RPTKPCAGRLTPGRPRTRGPRPPPALREIGWSCSPLLAPITIHQRGQYIGPSTGRQPSPEPFFRHLCFLDTGCMIRFEDLIEKVRATHPDADVELLRRAYVFSAYEHKGQVRRSGEPYLVHPLEVADLLADMRLDVVAISAGLLHDIVEDTPNTIDKVRELFGEQVAHVVEGVTKLSTLQFASSEERQAESFRKMLMAMVDDIRVILVKLADRLHNMRTLHHLPEERRLRIAQETRDIYAPLANRMGMSKVKNELEELAFRHLEPAAYQALRLEVERKRKATEGLIDSLRRQLETRLAEAQLTVRIDGRIKRLW